MVRCSYNTRLAGPEDARVEGTGPSQVVKFIQQLKLVVLVVLRTDGRG